MSASAGSRRVFFVPRRACRPVAAAR
jgi:hypothetical protein